MNLGQERLCRHIEQYNEGYTYVGETLILCPVYEIGINVLERTESRLPYIYEIVLKLVNTGINKVTDLCHWLGLEEGILSEIISDMAASLMLVDVSQACITLTPKGKQALGSLKLIEMQKSQLNEIYVNAISGSVMEDPPARLMPSPPPKPYMFLDRQHNLKLSFLNDHFETLASIHQGKKRSDLEYYSKTLFRLLSITYQELHYEAMPAHIYVHNSTRNIIVHFPYNRDFDYPSRHNQSIYLPHSSRVHPHDNSSPSYVESADRFPARPSDRRIPKCKTTAKTAVVFCPFSCCVMPQCRQSCHIATVHSCGACCLTSF